LDVATSLKTCGERVDAAALQHDMDYDLVEAEGFNGAFVDPKANPADKKLVTAANKVIVKADNGGLDSVTGKQVTEATKKRATYVGMFFSFILTNVKVEKPPVSPPPNSSNPDEPPKITVPPNISHPRN
jgi:hypothetical protein